MTFQGRSATSERPCMIFQKKIREKVTGYKNVLKRFCSQNYIYNSLLKRGVFLINHLFLISRSLLYNSPHAQVCVDYAQ